MGFCFRPCAPSWRWCVPECQPHLVELPTCEDLVIAEIAQRGVGNVAGNVISGFSSSPPPLLFSQPSGSPMFSVMPPSGFIPGGGIGGGGGGGRGGGAGGPGGGMKPPGNGKPPDIPPDVVIPPDDPIGPSGPSREIPEPSGLFCFVVAILAAWIIGRCAR